MKNWSQPENCFVPRLGRQLCFVASEAVSSAYFVGVLKVFGEFLAILGGKMSHFAIP
jgi:hypothetical protein